MGVGRLSRSMKFARPNLISVVCAGRIPSQHVLKSFRGPKVVIQLLTLQHDSPSIDLGAPVCLPGFNLSPARLEFSHGLHLPSKW